MAAARCQSCNINYPAGKMGCEVCNGPLAQNLVAVIHKDWEERVGRALASPADKDESRSWRITKLKSLGISEAISEVLADSPDCDWHYAEYLICKRGCPPELAERILV